MHIHALSAYGVFYGLAAIVLPAVASPFPLVARQDDTLSYSGYAFLYFSTNDEAIYLAASNGNDALSFTELNGGEPILTSSFGELGVRDPFIMRSVEQDKFFVLATDLCTRCADGSTWEEAVRFGSLALEIWESTDLINWSEQRHVVVSPETYGNTWAPEAYWDEDLGEYVVYWASAIYDEDDSERTTEAYQRMVYATTTDFVTFSEPAVWQDDGPAGRIDSTVIKEGDTWYRFTKATDDNECADIVQETTDGSLTGTLEEWDSMATCIGQNSGTANVEGPSIFKTNVDDIQGERWVLLVDEYSGNGYVPLESTDIASGGWTLATDYTFPTTPRHGTVISLTESELSAISSAYGA